MGKVNILGFIKFISNLSFSLMDQAHKQLSRCDQPGERCELCLSFVSCNPFMCMVTCVGVSHNLGAEISIWRTLTPK